MPSGARARAGVGTSEGRCASGCGPRRVLARCVVSGFSLLVRRALIPAGAQEVYSFSLSFRCISFLQRAPQSLQSTADVLRGHHTNVIFFWQPQEGAPDGTQKGTVVEKRRITAIAECAALFEITGDSSFDGRK